MFLRWRDVWWSEGHLDHDCREEGEGGAEDEVLSSGMELHDGDGNVFVVTVIFVVVNCDGPE